MTFQEAFYEENYDDDLYSEMGYEDNEYGAGNHEDDLGHVPQSFTKLIRMIEDEDSNRIIEANFTVSKVEMLLSILKYSEHFSVANDQTAYLCKMINSFVDRPIVPDTRYRIDQLCNTGEGVQYHAVCPTCKLYIKEYTRIDQQVFCTTCQVQVSVKSVTYRDFFVTVDICNEIKNLVEDNADYYDEVTSAREQAVQGEFRDIIDGQMYKKFVAGLPPEDKKSYLTAVFNSDGAPVFKSAKCSVWPIQLIIIELPVYARQKTPISFAFWFGRDKPDVSYFLSPFVNYMTNLSHNGIPCKMNDEVRNMKVFALCCCVDCVARAPLQGIIQFNGYYGCSWCPQKGELIFHNRGFVVKYPLLTEYPERRTEFDTVIHIQEAVRLGKPVYGMRRASPLLNLPGFGIIDGMVPDEMHCVPLGVVKQVTSYWIDTSNEPYSLSNDEILLIDELLKSLKPPNMLAKLSRSIFDRRHWKAKEWENWLLYYNLPILQQIPRFRKYLKHWAHLVQPFHLLMGDSISTIDLQTANRLLKVFVADTAELYTKDAMTYNIHQLIHIPQSVADWGPLWAHSCYAFESGNGKIVKSVHAAKGVIHQMCRNISMKQSIVILKKHLEKENFSRAIDFCYSLENRCTNKTYKVGNHRYFGVELEFDDALTEPLNLSNDSTRVYERLVKERCLFQSSNKTNARSSNSFAQLADSRFIEIVQFMIDGNDNRELTVCKEIRTRRASFDVCTSIREISIVNDNLITVETGAIKKICLYMTINRKQFITPVHSMHCYS